MGSGDGSSERPPARSKCLAPHSSTECVKHLSFTRDAEIIPSASGPIMHYRALFRPSVSSRLRIATRTRARSPATTRRRRRGDTLESVALARCAARRGRLRAVVLDRISWSILLLGRPWPCTSTMHIYEYVWARDTDLTVGGPAPSLSVTLKQTVTDTRLGVYRITPWRTRYNQVRTRVHAIKVNAIAALAPPLPALAGQQQERSQ